MIQRTLACGLALAVLALAAGAVMASSSANYSLAWSAPAGGEGAMSGAQYRARGSIASGGAGVVQSAGYRMHLGFWSGVAGSVAARPTAVPATPGPWATPSGPATGDGLYLPLLRRGV